MTKPKFSRKPLLIITVLVCCFLISSLNFKPKREQINGEFRENIHPSGDMNNYDFISTVMDDLTNIYGEYGYFPTYYEPSIQSTYFALQSYLSLGRISDLNETEIISFLIDHYDTEQGYFIDDYAIRYLDTDFEAFYLPLNTLLEVNCYALLSLKILNRLDLINNQSFIDFIWSCFNSDEGAFIGQPYDVDLHPKFKIPTLDNTYYAVKILDLLLDTWDEYYPQRSQLITFIEDCQTFITKEAQYGGFKNDLVSGFSSLRITDPNMLSSFYALETLNTFNALEAINIDAFNQFLKDLYNIENFFFELSWFPDLPTHGRPFATSIGLSLSLLTGYNEINEMGIVNYLKSIRNNIGVWKSSINDLQFELIDTFQVLRSLYDSRHINDFTNGEKDAIADGLEHFKSYQSYCNTPTDYMSISALSSIAKSFKIFNRETDLEIQELFVYLRDAYISDPENEPRSFYGYTNMDAKYLFFRIYPIEYYNLGTYSSLEYIDYLFNHKFVYQALTALKDLYKLDDFDTFYALNELLDQTVLAQIINPNSDKFGAFLPNSLLLNFDQDLQDKTVFLEQSFYAIRTMELLRDYLELGSLEELLLDSEALKVYIFNTFEAPGSYCYSMPRATSDVNIILKNTYYASYIMKSLDSFTQDTQKIKNYIMDHLDYNDIENIYYSYLLDQLLELDIEFPIESVQALIQELYCEDLNCFYLTTEKNKINQQILYWICDMAKNDKYRYNINFDDVILLDSYSMITVEIQNLILNSIGQYGSLKFESDQLGEYAFTEFGEGVFRCNVFVPFDVSNYPTIEGNISRYEFSTKQEVIPISFNTTYELFSEINFLENANTINIEINCSLNIASGSRNLPDGESFMHIYHEGEYIATDSLSYQQNGDYTKYFLEYEYTQFGNYSFELYVNDGLNESDHFIGKIMTQHSYQLISEVSISRINTTINFIINASMMVEGSEIQPFSYGSAFLKIYREGTYIQQKNFIGEDRDTYTHFETTYMMIQTGNYSFELYLDDGLNPSQNLIYEYFTSYGNEPQDPTDPQPNGTNEPQIPLILFYPIILLPLFGSSGAIAFTFLKKKQLKTLK
ncbi:MAG: hypothetical protein R6W84_15405 [Promethearchaeia archaeon]